jgi:hypothetical protein
MPTDRIREAAGAVEDPCTCFHCLKHVNVLPAHVLKVLQPPPHHQRQLPPLPMTIHIRKSNLSQPP